MHSIVILDLIQNLGDGVAVIPRGSGNPQGGRVAMRQHRHSGLDAESRGWGKPVIPRGSGNPQGAGLKTR